MLKLKPSFQERFVSIDLIRLFLAILGIIYHTSLCFSFEKTVTITSYTLGEPLPYLKYFNIFIHSFRMQIFFIISGFLFKKQLQLNLLTFLRKYFVKISIPLIFFSLVILPLMFLTINLKPFYRTPDYLWFIYYILLFFILTKLIDFSLNTEIKNKSKLFLSKYKFLLLTPVLIIVFIFLLDNQYELPIPGNSWSIKLKTFTVYYLYFLTGLLIPRDSINQFKLLPIKYKLLVFISFIILVPFIFSNSSPSFFLQSINYCTRVIFPFLVFVNLFIFFEYISLRIDLKKIYSISYFKLYLLHKPILIVLIYLFYKIAITGWFCLVLVIFLTSILCITIDKSFDYFLKKI